MSGGNIVRVRTARLRDEDDVEVLGENLVQNELGQDHISEMHETLKYDKTPKVRDDFRCRLNRIAKYWLKETPGYAERGVRLVTEEEKIIRASSSGSRTSMILSMLE